MKRKQTGGEKRTAFNELTPVRKLSLAESIKHMRDISGKTQIEFAKFLKLAPRIIMDLENGRGNPTLKTLNKIGAAFGLHVVFAKTLD